MYHSTIQFVLDKGVTKVSSEKETPYKATQRCRWCGAWHGGGVHSDAPNVCEECYAKRKR